MSRPVSLLDRLSLPTGEAPPSLHDTVLRDLEALFNAARPQPGPSAHRGGPPSPWSTAPYASASGLNFGLPAWSGQSWTSARRRDMEGTVLALLRGFEPRLLDPFVTVAPAATPDRRGPALRVNIDARLWHAGPEGSVPITVAIYFDVDSGRARLRDRHP